MTQTHDTFEIACFAFALGLAGAALGAWVLSRSLRQQLEFQRRSLQQAHGQAGDGLQQALTCVPQWIQRAVRAELELVARLQAERSAEQLCEQQRWQAGQDALRLAEWRELVATGAQTQTPMDRTRELVEVPVPPPLAAPSHGWDARGAAAERELSDAEIDALPPDLPTPARSSRKKWASPAPRLMRNV